MSLTGKILIACMAAILFFAGVGVDIIKIDGDIGMFLKEHAFTFKRILMLVGCVLLWRFHREEKAKQSE